MATAFLKDCFKVFADGLIILARDAHGFFMRYILFCMVGSIVNSITSWTLMPETTFAVALTVIALYSLEQILLPIMRGEFEARNRGDMERLMARNSASTTRNENDDELEISPVETITVNMDLVANLQNEEVELETTSVLSINHKPAQLEMSIVSSSNFSSNEDTPTASSHDEYGLEGLLSDIEKLANVGLEVKGHPFDEDTFFKTHDATIHMFELSARVDEILKQFPTYDGQKEPLSDGKIESIAAFIRHLKKTTSFLEENKDAFEIKWEMWPHTVDIIMFFEDEIKFLEDVLKKGIDCIRRDLRVDLHGVTREEVNELMEMGAAKVSTKKDDDDDNCLRVEVRGLDRNEVIQELLQIAKNRCA